MTDPGAFWEDLARDLADPAFAREYVAESELITEVVAAIDAEAAAAYDALVADPSRGMTADKPRTRLAERRRLSR